MLPSGDLVLSRTKYAFQQRVMMPLWKRLHPLYMRVAGTAVSVLGWVHEFLEVLP